jgi:hypothetical protein
MAPQAITMTRASSMLSLLPVLPIRHVTLRAVDWASVPMRTTKASVINSTALPPRAQRWAVSAIGT